MSDLIVTTGTARYSVVVEPGALATLPDRLKAIGLRGALWLVSDSAVFPYYGPLLEERLRADGRDIQSYIVPAGEGSKCHAQLEQLYTWMIGGGVERGDGVLALGGGVVGDLAGFAAATILRGIALIQLPTTLLAMVDASIGGKTGINHALGKNLIGAFHQPRLVLSDPATLHTLPARELRAGWAEAIKHGVIHDADLFALLEQHMHDLSPSETPAQVEVLSAVIRRAAAVKVGVVSADEREQGTRIILNYGHTLGHALEAALGYQTLLHGEAVAIGMHAAARIAARLGLWSTQDVERQRRLLTAYGLPTNFPQEVAVDQILDLTLHDKKVQQKRVRWVLPTAIGAVTVRDDVPQAIIREVLLTKE